MSDTRMRDVWGPAAICSTIALALGSAVGSAYIRDQTRTESRVTVLEEARIADARESGRSDQELEELRALSHINRDRIEMSRKELDDVLQREMRILDEALRTEINGNDARLREMLAAQKAERVDLLAEIRRRLESLEKER